MIGQTEDRVYSTPLFFQICRGQTSTNALSVKTQRGVEMIGFNSDRISYHTPFFRDWKVFLFLKRNFGGGKSILK